jgi:hypothetical protein
VEFDLDWHERMWWDEGWQATPTPATPTTPKLIPIVTTASTVDVVELAQTYTQRWAAQENSIRDFLLPLGLDYNHGYHKTPVENSEEACETMPVSSTQNGASPTCDRATALYRILNDHQIELEQQGMES